MPKVPHDISPALHWFETRNWKPFAFQQATWKAYLEGKNGLLNAPTGSGKTYALWPACLMEALNQPNPAKGLQIIWVTPLRALAKDIQAALQMACNEMGVDWTVGLRTGDTSQKEKKEQQRHMPQALVTTPESIHVLLSQKNAPQLFKHLSAVIVDEWHELLGSKRGVQMELALAYFRHHNKNKIKTWGISATIGNLEEASKVLMGNAKRPFELIKAKVEKRIRVQTLLPDSVDSLPWTGHLGLHMSDDLLPIIQSGQSTLLFTNVRSQTEVWYQHLLEKAPDLAGQMAMHHGSLDHQVRGWVEDNLHLGKLKCVVCTSSLDLGVDFRPVDQVVQIGGPKGVARFFQRAGRSGHRPGEESVVYFLPTHSLELIEASVMKEAIKQKAFESRTPLTDCYDVLIQYLVTLAVGPGFYPEAVKAQVKSTNAFTEITEGDWQWCLSFITTGGQSLGAYDEFAKVYISGEGKYVVTSRKTAMRHRLSMGTIVSDPMVKVKFVKGGFIGVVEESFIAKLKPGDNFWYAGRSLELVRVKDLTAQVKKSNKSNGPIPRWGGGKASFTSLLSHQIRLRLEAADQGKFEDVEMQTIAPLLTRQQSLSALPHRNELLIEQIKSDEGTHLFFYPFEGKYVHDVLAALVAYRISVSQPISFSIATNDYGFELLTDQNIEVEDFLELDLLHQENVLEDVMSSINNTELAKRKFRDIAAISGLIFQGYPGKNVTGRHLQASAGMIFKVFEDYEPDNLLLRQAHQEVLNVQNEENRVMEAMRRMNQQKIVVKKLRQPTPFCFPIMVDRLRERFTTEKLSERIARMQVDFQGESLNL